MEVIVGTAGHIDHGKTALVKALTGVDADRLPEEKRRGITVDLGFAEMIVGETHFGFVDVPGHEGFVKNMLAGAGGIDIVMLVIAANEGVMPQTREHFDICRLLGVTQGLVVLTKSDLVDSDALDLARLEAAELVAGSFLENAPVLNVSSPTGDGIQELKQTLAAISQKLPKRDERYIARLPIDRSFSVKGFGAVVTGTLTGGEIAEGAEMELLPDGVKVRVRGLQTHNRTVKTAYPGQRVAVNLGGIDHSKVTRGLTLVPPGILQTTQIIDADVEVLPSAAKPLKSGRRLRVHIGTTEVLARIHVLNNAGEIAAGGRDLAQLRFERGVVVIPGERFILRSYSPQTTIAGGEILDALASKHYRKDVPQVRQYLNALKYAIYDAASKVQLVVSSAGKTGMTVADLQSRTAFTKDVLSDAVAKCLSSSTIVDAKGWLIATDEFNVLLRSAENSIADFHAREPLKKGIPREVLREQAFSHLPVEIFLAAIDTLQSSNVIASDGETLRLTSYETQLSPAETALIENIRTIYVVARLEVPRLDEALEKASEDTGIDKTSAQKYFRMFLDSGEIVKVSEEFYFTRTVLDELAEQFRTHTETTPDRLIDVPTFKELAGISRKYAIPLLEYFDRERVTVRTGDKRRIY